MRQINIFQSKQQNGDDVLGPSESDPEYLLIVEANNLVVEIDDEICMKFNIFYSLEILICIIFQ